MSVHAAFGTRDEDGNVVFDAEVTPQKAIQTDGGGPVQ